MPRPPCMLVLTILFFAPPAQAVQPPPVGDEVLLDHGFRYPNDVFGQSQRCVISLADTTVLMAYGEGDAYGIRGYLRSPGGKEMGINAFLIGSRDRNTGPFDISGYDGTDWKIAYLSDLRDVGSPDFDWTSLWLRAVDPRTMLPSGAEIAVVPPGTHRLRMPAMAWTGVRHLLAWTEGGGSTDWLQLLRVRPDMSFEDLVPVTVAVDIGPEPIAIAADKRGGMILWSDTGFHLYAGPLDASGAPTGAPQVLGTLRSDPGPQFDVCRYQRGWFAAWTDPNGIGFTAVDSLGNPARRGTSLLQTYETTGEGFAVAAVDSTAMVAWRGGTWPGSIRTARITPTQWGWDIQAADLSNDAPYLEGLQPYIFRDPRNVDCAWTGRSFAILWNEWVYPPVGNGKTAREGEKGRSRDSAYGPWPVYSQWLSRDGEPLYADPIRVSQASYPADCGALRMQEGFVAYIRDESSDSYIHTLILDDGGRPQGPAGRYETGAIGSGGDWMDSWFDVISGMRVRSCSGAAAVLYAEHSDAWSWDGYSEHWETVHLDLLDPQGARANAYKVTVGHDIRPVPSADVYDLARGPDSYLAAYSSPRNGGPPGAGFVRAVQLDLQGNTVRTWSVISDSECAVPTVGAIGGKYLMIWKQGTARPQLFRAILDPAVPGDNISGQPLLPGFGSEGPPYLVPGSGQLLLVFPGKPNGTADDDVYAMRIDMDGAPVDVEPKAICPSPGNQGNVAGVWDSNQYLLAWSNVDQGHEAILGGRIASDGVVIDSTAFLIQAGVSGPVSLASDAYGNVLAAYGGNRVRPIADVIPILTDDGPGWDQTNPGERSLWVGRVIPNPGVGRVHLDLDLPLGRESTVEVLDAVGRLVRSDRYDGSGPVKGWFWDGHRADGAPAPSGAYFLRVRAGREGAVRKAYLIR